MNTPKTKIVQIYSTMKQWCLEQLWLFALLTPLIALAVLGVMHWQAKSKSHNSKAETLIEVVTGSVEITSTEVALIVAKPIGELIKMQVYFEEKTSRKRGQLLAELKVEDVFLNGASNQMLVSARGRNSFQALTYLGHLKNKKNQKMAEQS